MSNAPNDADSVYESRLHGLLIDTKDPGQANFVIGVRALGNASGTPLDGSQDISFGKSTVDGEFTIDGDEDGVLSVPGYNVPSGHDQSDPNVIMDPAVIAALVSPRSITDPRSPTVQFNEQVKVTEYPLDGEVFAFDADPSTSAENVGGIETSSPAQGDPPLSQSKGNANAGGDRNSNDSNGNGGNQGGTVNGNDPQGLVPHKNYLNQLVFSCCTRGGTGHRSQNWLASAF